MLHHLSNEATQLGAAQPGGPTRNRERTNEGKKLAIGTYTRNHDVGATISKGI